MFGDEAWHAVHRDRSSFMAPLFMALRCGIVTAVAAGGPDWREALAVGHWARETIA